VQRDHLPAAADVLDDAQRAYVSDLARALDAAAWNGESVQAVIFSTAAARELAAGQAFAAIYLAFLGRPSGPRAGWLLAALDRDFVTGRLREAAGAAVGA
jgi:lysyl-tRNA synthetase, class I